MNNGDIIFKKGKDNNKWKVILRASIGLEAEREFETKLDAIYYAQAWQSELTQRGYSVTIKY